MHSRLYIIYLGMKSRCLDPSSTGYKNYGAKGVQICQDWNSFQSFKEWALNNGYSENLTLDRIDPTGHYEPSNCRWTDFKTQQNNRTNNHIVEFNGEKKTLQEWSEVYNIKWTTLYKRLQSGWSIEKTLTTPVRKYKKKI